MPDGFCVLFLVVSYSVFFSFFRFFVFFFARPVLCYSAERLQLIFVGQDRGSFQLSESRDQSHIARPHTLPTRYEPRCAISCESSDVGTMGNYSSSSAGRGLSSSASAKRVDSMICMISGCSMEGPSNTDESEEDELVWLPGWVGLLLLLVVLLPCSLPLEVGC